MDHGHTFSTPYGDRVMLYAPPEFTPPERLVLSFGGEAVTFSRLDPAVLLCDDVPGIKGHCTSPDCHRSPLGVCKCGRHKGKQPYVRAVRS